jgi:hypothetical protein
MHVLAWQVLHGPADQVGAFADALAQLVLEAGEAAG